jgi:hypothetical protein
MPHTPKTSTAHSLLDSYELKSMNRSSELPGSSSSWSPGWHAGSWSTGAWNARGWVEWNADGCKDTSSKKCRRDDWWYSSQDSSQGPEQHGKSHVCWQDTFECTKPKEEMAVAEFFTCAGVIMEDYRIRCHDMSNVESLRRLQHWVTKICNSLGRWPRAWLSPQELLNVLEERNCRDLNLFVLSNGPLASVVKLLEAQSTQIDQIINQIKVDIPYDKMHVKGSDGVQDEWCNFDIEGYLDGACAGAFGHLQSDETMTMKRQILPHVLLKFFRCGQYYE